MPESHTSTHKKEDEALDLGLGQRVSVLLPLPLEGSYDYITLPETMLQPGDIVTVPLGKREVLGVVWEDDRLNAGRDGPPLPESRLKAVIERLPVAAITETARRFIEWLAAYYLAPPGNVLRMALNTREALELPRRIALYEPVNNEAKLEGLRLTPARRRVLEGLADGPALPLADLAREAGVSSSVIKGLEAAGVLRRVEVEQRRRFAEPDWQWNCPELSCEQADAAKALCGELHQSRSSVTLLDGITGSGKTEVYFEAIADVLRKGGQALVLLPEIALSSQWLDRFARRFGALPAVWHSDLGQKERRETWRAISENRVKIVVGARSALFLPFQDLSLIVVDEEHDTSFKQEEGVHYHARDMAVVLGRLGNFPVVLASATPSLETLVNVERKGYQQLKLTQRHGVAELPEIEVVDLRRDQPLRHPGVPGAAGQSWLSTALRGAISETLGEGEQAMLFLNRRGYAPLTLCRTCGHRLQCPNCTAWLVEHRLLARLQCHHCGYTIALPSSCPECESQDSLAACGPGVERLAEEVKRLYPGARQGVMASDTLSGPGAAAELIAAVQEREVDILIGTQIAAKGYHFPYLTLVCVVDGDLGLYGGDLRAAERTYQLLQQVAGRAGRAERSGRVMIQTSEPEHPVMEALVSGDRDRFMDAEADGRKKAGLPPFGRLAAVILSGEDSVQLDRLAAELARRAPHAEGLEVLGPAPAPLSMLRGRHRRRFLMRADKNLAIQSQIRGWLGSLKLTGSLRVQVDIDPYSFL